MRDYEKRILTDLIKKSRKTLDKCDEFLLHESEDEKDCLLVLYNFLTVIEKDPNLSSSLLKCAKDTFKEGGQS